jgi:hypothetical protein
MAKTVLTVVKQVRQVACMGQTRNVYTILVRNPVGKRPRGRPRNRWKDIRMDLTEIGWKWVDWIHVAQDRDQWRALVNMAIVFHKRREFLD